MDNIQELKKLKDLLDEGILTQEEFDQQKHKLLSDDVSDSVDQNNEQISEVEKPAKKPINKAMLKRIGIIVGVLVILICAVFAGKSIVKHNQQNKRADALETGIQSIMSDYGISHYDVRYVDYDYEVYAEGFESLTNGEALECLKALDRVSVEDPCGDGKLEFFMTNVHPGMDVEYSYWRVSSATVTMNEMYGGNYKTPGIYCNRSGSNKCVYECKN